MRWQFILLIFLILLSALVVALNVHPGGSEKATVPAQLNGSRSALSNFDAGVPKVPERDWNVLDPQISSEAVILESLDDNFPFFKYGSYRIWPLASLTKLLTAAVVVEKIGLNEKIEITPEVMAVQGEAGDLRLGEIYSARDLLKIMLMMSSNRAAAAFEFHIGHDQFVKMAMEKARAIGMTQTTVYDASGLDDLNTGTASDTLLLIKYVLEREPEILSYTRLPNFLVQPLNGERSHTVTNIDPLAVRADFLGGKTGTSEAAGQNLAAIISLKNRRMAIMILGSRDRFKETDDLLAWVEKAYEF